MPKSTLNRSQSFPASPETKNRLQIRLRYKISSVKSSQSTNCRDPHSSSLRSELFGVLSLIDYNTWGMKKPYFFDVRPLLPCFVPTANGKAEDDDENNINITLMSSQNCKICSKYCCHATQRCLRWNTNMADKVGYHDDIEIWSRECIHSIWATPK